MGWLTSLVMAPILGPIKGLALVAEQIGKQVDTELYDEDLAQQQLMELQIRYEMGDLSKEDYDRGEAALLARLNEIMERREKTEA